MGVTGSQANELTTLLKIGGHL